MSAASGTTARAPEGNISPGTTTRPVGHREQAGQRHRDL
jgi:hypothetical protein